MSPKSPIAGRGHSGRPRDTRLGQMLRTIRADRGLTQEQLGEAMGVTREQVAQIETGRVRYDLKPLRRLVAILGVPGDELLEALGLALGDESERMQSSQDRAALRVDAALHQNGDEDAGRVPSAGA